jgi:hydroxymethylpyrimidine pyrophosphatase-like HAD family hydrolase
MTDAARDGCPALATDYDGTLARNGRVDGATADALHRLRAAGWLLVLVTGRNLDDVGRAFPELAVFDRVVAENGAVVAGGPAQPRLLGPEPDPALLQALRRRGVAHSTGRVIVHTLTLHQAAVIAAVVELSPNKAALMLLPVGVDKARGLKVALDELRADARDAVGVGDAENDLPFLHMCGRAYACADAVPAVRVAARSYTPTVRALVEELLNS